MPYPVIDTGERFLDADGAEHVIVLELDRGGAWCVLDVTAEHCRLVERLCGHDDGDEQVAALVDQYLAAARAHAAGDRERMPTPDPLPLADSRRCPPAITRPRRRGGAPRRPRHVDETTAA